MEAGTGGSFVAMLVAAVPCKINEQWPRSRHFFVYNDTSCQKGFKWPSETLPLGNGGS